MSDWIPWAPGRRFCALRHTCSKKGLVEWDGRRWFCAACRWWVPSLIELHPTELARLLEGEPGWVEGRVVWVQTGNTVHLLEVLNTDIFETRGVMKDGREWWRYVPPWV